MLSFMGQGRLGRLDKLATFACLKRISENPNCLLHEPIEILNVDKSMDSNKEFQTKRSLIHLVAVATASVGVKQTF